MNPIDQIALNYEKMTKNEKKIADMIISDPKNFIRLDLSDILLQLQVSKAAMVRFCKKLGFSGYNEYFYELRRFIMTGNQQNTQNKIIHTITQAYIQGIHDLETALSSQDIQELSSMILNSHQVWSVGINRSALSAQHLSLRALSVNIGIQSIVNDLTYIKDMIRIATSKDLFIFFTVKDNSLFYSTLISLLKQRNIHFVLVTFNPKLNLIQYAQKSIILPSTFKTYGTFYDEQALFLIFIEMLVHEMILQKK